MIRPVKTSVLLISAIAVLLAAAGCSDDDPVQIHDQEDPVPGPASPDQLVAQFRAAYEARYVDNYLALLDPDFLMILTQETTFDFPEVGPTLDFAEEERIHTRMFSGDNVTDLQGNLVPGVQNIDFSVFLPLDAWSPSVDIDHFPDAVYAPFQVVIHFDRGQNFSTMKVEGTVVVYARAHESAVAGEKETYYLLAGMTDLTYLAKGTETASWGGIKALYR